MKSSEFNQLIRDLELLERERERNDLAYIHAFGKRILEEKNLAKYGEIMEVYGRIARHFNYSVAEIRHRVRFAEKFPDFERDFVAKFDNALSKLPSWYEVCREYLYEKEAEFLINMGTQEARGTIEGQKP